MTFQASPGSLFTAKAGTKSDPRPTLLCFSHLRWNFVYQRPQHLLSRATLSHDVIFFEEPVFRGAEPPTLELSRQKAVTIAVPILPIGMNEESSVQAQKALVDDLLDTIDHDRLVTWYYTPLALTFSDHLTPALCVYDNMDELSAFLGASHQLVTLERELFDRAHLVFTGGKSLFEAKRERHHSVHAFPSSIDFDHFSAARRIRNEPAAQLDIPHPRLGFFGVIDERMNLDLVREIADACPDWQLIMVGPVVKIDPATLPQRSNIHWLGAQTYDDLPRFLASWDIGLMPFAINESTRFISPTKTPEFLAAGLRVVSTPIVDVIRPYGDLGLVEIADDAAGFIDTISTLLGRPRAEKADWQKSADQFLSKMSWDKTWQDMLALMRDARSPKGIRKIATASTSSLEAESV